jgi:hypothetical protein
MFGGIMNKFADMAIDKQITKKFDDIFGDDK